MLTPEIKNVLSQAISAGALVGKVSGAGGGGFLTSWASLVNRKNVIDALYSCDGNLAECNFCSQGAISWETDDWISENKKLTNLSFSS